MKKWHESRTVQIQALQIAQTVTGMLTLQYFPDMSSGIIGTMAIITVLLGKLQIYVRSLPDHGVSITIKQQLKRVGE